ncbi:MAG: EmrB/QacA family drug resistance transporter [Candidatus Rokubacteria bacterium GWC2_70_16]|nr:MAG: EmrB/QacA family drug resistance transporter [Candidatus Rokubacteria bacterium GWC2_70_16]OGL20713.1 MAG: EmrB/QacA family drug resistance transporter [Candidatus Rokubacteria bacterium RIFCSPLOWO2_12_FULL_71_19]
MQPPAEAPVSAPRKWLITLSIMLVAVMQILDTSVTNVALPHMQGALSAGVEEVAWVITSFLAANAVIIPATGWLAGLLGRRRFFLICTTLFTVSSFLSGLAPNLTFLIAMRVLQGIGGGPVIPLSQAILWEIFPLGQRGMAMAVWGIGIMMGPILGPTLGGWLADNWSWRWIFYINLPIGLLGFFMASVFLFDPSYLRKPGRVDALGLVLIVVGFGCLQLVLDRGEREDWFDSGFIATLAVVAALALAGFLVRELTTHEPILDLRVFADRNFAAGSTVIAMVGFGLYSSMILVALYTQKLMGYDAWTAGLVLAPGGVGNMLSLLAAGQLVTRMDQRLLLTVGCLLNALGLYWMTFLTLGMDYWTLVWPRFLQGLGLGFIFVPLATLTLATIRKDRLGNATSAFNVLRNLGGSIGVALATTLLSRRSQVHQATLAGHVDVWDPETAARLAGWTGHFVAQGADTFTAKQRALAMLYHDIVTQAQVLAYMDDFWLLAVLFSAIPFLIPLMRRVRVAPE